MCDLLKWMHTVCPPADNHPVCLTLLLPLLQSYQIKQWASDNPPPTRSRNAQPRHTDPSSQPPLLLDNQPDAGKSCADDAEAVAVTEESNRGNAAEIAEDDDELLPGVKALLDMRHTLLGSSE